MTITNIIPLSLYIHIPWCVKKCPYCDFNSHQVKNPTNTTNIDQNIESDYIQSLILDLKQSISNPDLNSNSSIAQKTIHSIFIGGGTPSLFSGKAIASLLEQINNVITIPKDCEITLEANPGTFEAKKFRDFKLAGINRLSIGVQSFNNTSLKLLGRVHNNNHARQAIECAKELDLNLNIDLMHSLPQQTKDLALKDLEIAASYKPNHISWYQLTIEPNTKFAKHPPVLPNDQIMDNIYIEGTKLLEQSGYKQYEISAFSNITNNDFDKNKSKHNLNYWRFGDYLGIGAGAHSKITVSEQKIIRKWKQKSPIRYLDNKINKISGSQILSNKEILAEYMMNKLRILEPITEEELQKHTNLLFNDISLTLNTAISNKWLQLQRNNIQITDLGRMFLNDLILLFV